MGVARFGELLGRFVPLSGHDLAEILEHQRACPRRFGQIALCLGLCRPEHVWRAWSVQLAQRRERVDLHIVGIDTQALSQMPPHIAREFMVVPIRWLGDQLICAAAEDSIAQAAEQLPVLLNRQILFVTVDQSQLSAALRHYYPQTRRHDPLAVSRIESIP